jgi:spore coat protein CotH
MKTTVSLTVLLAFLCQPSAAVDEAASPQVEFFDPDVIQTIQLEIDAADLQRLNDALPERIYVPAKFRWRDKVLERVGLRYKGNSSSHPDPRHKRSFLIKFNEYVKGQRFLGLRRLRSTMASSSAASSANGWSPTSCARWAFLRRGRTTHV